jgi:hypothetical protein
LGLQGTLKVNFSPASGHLSFEQDLGLAPGLKTGVDTGDNERAMRSALVEHLRDTADRVRQRLEKPSSVGADWRVATEFRFAPRS